MINSEVWRLWERAQLDELLEGMSATAFMLRFTLTNPDRHTTIVGTLPPEHLHENMATGTRGPLPPAVYHEAQRRLAAARVELSEAALRLGRDSVASLRHNPPAVLHNASP